MDNIKIIFDPSPDEQSMDFALSIGQIARDLGALTYYKSVNGLQARNTPTDGYLITISSCEDTINMSIKIP